MATSSTSLTLIRSAGVIAVCAAFAMGCASKGSKQTVAKQEPVKMQQPAATTPVASPEIQPAPIQEAAVETPVENTGDTNEEKLPQIELSSGPAEPGQKMFQFGFDKIELSDNDKEVLKQHAEFAFNNPELVVNINGHTDHHGPRVYNEYLSKLRAEKVAEVLIANGVSESQIVINALADSQPLSENTDQRKNRRVEIEYTEINLVSK